MRDVALAVMDLYRPIFDRLGDPVVKLKDLFIRSDFRFSRKKFRRRK